MKGKKQGASGKSSLSSLAAGLSTGGRPAPASPKNPLVAALARKGAASQRITAGLMAKTAKAPAEPESGRGTAAGSGLFKAAASKPVKPTPAPVKLIAPRASAARSAPRPSEKAAPVKLVPPRASASRPTHPEDSRGKRAPMKLVPVRATPVRAVQLERSRGTIPARPPVTSARPPVTPGSQPHSRPGPSSGIPAGLAGTSKTAASVAPLVKSANDSRAAPKKGVGKDEHRRQYPRADLQVRAQLSLADDPSHRFEAALPTANLSVGGQFLASTFFLKLGTKLEVRLSLPPHGREVHVKAEVVRIDSEVIPGFALRFTDYLDGSEVVLATHFLSPVLREFIAQYALGNGFKPTPEYLSHTADVLAAWELRRAALGGDVWVVPGDR